MNASSTFFDLLRPLPNRHAGVDSAISMLMQPDDTASLLATCAIVSVFALGLFAIIRHRLEAGATALVVDRHATGLLETQNEMSLGMREINVLLDEGKTAEALQSMEKILDRFGEMGEFTRGAEDVDHLTDAYSYVILACNPFLQMEAFSAKFGKVINKLEESKSQVESAPDQWGNAYEEALRSLKSLDPIFKDSRNVSSRKSARKS